MAGDGFGLNVAERTEKSQHFFQSREEFMPPTTLQSQLVYSMILFICKSQTNRQLIGADDRMLRMTIALCYD